MSAGTQASMLAEILGCPVCHATVADARCTACGRSYPNGDYTPVPPPDADVQAKWGLWEQLQANFVDQARLISQSSQALRSLVHGNIFSALRHGAAAFNSYGRIARRGAMGPGESSAAAEDYDVSGAARYFSGTGIGCILTEVTSTKVQTSRPS